MQPIKVYTDKSHYLPARRIYLNDILRALWNDSSQSERERVYGSRAILFKEVDSVEMADLYLLPLTWNYYVEHNQVGLAEQAAERARQAGKELVVFSEGDFTANIPFKNTILFEKSAYRSRRRLNGNYIYAKPAFIADYLNIYCQGKLQVRQKRDKPVIGFCGQAGGSSFDFLRRSILRSYRQIAFKNGWLKWEPAPFETTQFRAEILNLLSSSSLIESNFAIRKRYRAGYWANKKDPFHPTRLEFINNLLNSDYTLSIRGGGNFSVRFYETLSLGRIPVFVNTDCQLPFDDKVDYRKYCVWVEEDEIPYMAEKIADFHRAMSTGEFTDLQFTCRALWQERLSMDGFYRHFIEHFSNVASHQGLKC